MFMIICAATSRAFLSPALSTNTKMDTRHQLSMASSSNQPAGSKQRAVIVGGGPAGALMALYLSQDRGFKVDLFEAFDENKIAGPTVRSWNVVLFDRGSDALKAGGVDLQKEVRWMELKCVKVCSAALVVVIHKTVRRDTDILTARLRLLTSP